MARSVDCNVVLKYCEILDEFIKVRVFSEEDIGELLQVKSIPNKSAYQQLVVNACVVSFHDEVVPMLKKLHRVYKQEALEELLYQICVEVNPHLEIHQVSLPLESTDARSGQLHLLQAPGLDRQKDSMKHLNKVQQAVEASLIGQPEAVETVMRAIRKAAAGLKDPRRPIGAFLMVGQTGTGKTELAKMMARHVFGDPGRLVRVDCSEFALPHEYAKLIGAPPGYVGHNDGGQLTEAMKERKAGVVLFDEIEKAHRKVHNLLLQIMDEGFLTDSKGCTVPFNQGLVLMTSNLGVEELKRIRNRVGFTRSYRDPLTGEIASDATLDAIRGTFPPEFVNRLDGVIVFNPLTHKHCVQIARNQLAQVAQYLSANGIGLVATRQAAQRIAHLGFSTEYGAREIRRTIQTLIEEPLSERILRGDFRRGDHVRISVRARCFLFEKQSAPRKGRRARPVEPVSAEHSPE